MKPYVICYMMTSVDGRIDCAMTAQLKGVDNYYRVLDELDVPTTVSGHTTAKLEMALPGAFSPKNYEVLGREAFARNSVAAGYEVVVDSKGTLLWEKGEQDGKPLLVITSIQVTNDYLSYLDSLGISWIACGDTHADLAGACQILAEHFGVRRLGVVGGPTLNTSFLEAGLLDEIAVLIGPGIDGRREMPSVFEGRKGAAPLPLSLLSVKAYEDGSVLLRYRV